MELLSDTYLIFLRYLRQAVRSPVFMFIGLIQPILYLCLFAPLLEKVFQRGPEASLAGDSWQVYVPGLLVQLALFGTTFAGFGIISEWRMGVFERMRVTPVNRLALLLGRVFRDVLVLLLQSVLLIAVAFAFGLRAPLLGIAVGLVFVVLLAMTMASLSYTAALTVKSEYAFAPLLNMVCIPLLLLTGILLPMSYAPAWLNGLSMLNPLRYILDAMRQVFLGEYLNPTVLIGALVAVVCAAVAVALGAQTFRRENA